MAIGKQIGALDVNSANYENKTTVVGQPDVPGLGTKEMQESVEYMPRNLIAPKVNELVQAVNDSYSKQETDSAIAQKVLDIGSGDMAKAKYDPNNENLTFTDLRTARTAIGEAQRELANRRYVIVVLRPEGWSGAAPYTYTIQVPGITENWVPGIPWHNWWDGLTNEDLTKRLEEMSKIKLIRSANGSLTFTAPDEKPDCALDLCVPGEVYSGTTKSDDS